MKDDVQDLIYRLENEDFSSEIGFKEAVKEYPTSWNIFAMAMVWGFTVFQFYLTLFFLKYLPGNVYENHVLSLSLIVMWAFVPFLINKLGFIRVATLVYGFGAFASLTLYFFDPSTHFYIYILGLAISRSFNIISYGLLFFCHS